MTDPATPNPATSDRPFRIIVAGTGGTIASTGADPANSVDYQVTTTVGSLIEGLAAHVPGISVQAEQIVNVDSSEIGNALLLEIARGAAAILARPEVDALVLTHGTDSLEETAYFLHLVLKTGKPVVMVGAMRPASALGADGPANLVDGLRVAAEPAAAGLGVLVLSNGAVYSARDILKTHPVALDALGAARRGPLGELSGSAVFFHHRPVPRHTLTSAFDLAEIAALPTVDILFDHQEARELFYAAALDGGAQALVIAAYGNGSLSPGALHGIARARAVGVPVIRASRTMAGVVSARPEEAETGLISALGLTPQKARILMLCALASQQPLSKLQELFATH
ncbi:asparaginase [Paracoccus aminophilus]|uniref:L-asparaginase n=1 Tax=Paracoccus aminophilus JCM 7686 TaxID=1367847 RepID=S5Z1E8_PARAH|nr:asparaginase [Paracoccus aminophilus]AGT11266.1 L-asparaginase [Paracoccus aminophilus JCM 7686]